MSTTRRSIHCSHCNEKGHYISTCNIFQIHFNLSIVNESVSYIPDNMYSPRKVNLNQLAEFKCLYNKDIPFIIYSRYIVSYSDNNDIITISEKKTVNDIKKYKLKKVININKEAQYYNDFKTRFNFYLNNILPNRIDSSVKLTDLIDIFNHDYTNVTTRLNNVYTIQEERWEREEREELEQLRRDRELENTVIITREHLPTLVDTPFHADNCPICLDTLGLTDKTILRCGHPLCTPCLLTITLVCAHSQNKMTGICSICRAPFL